MFWLSICGRIDNRSGKGPRITRIVEYRAKRREHGNEEERRESSRKRAGEPFMVF
jgi:hypothetical protein